MTDSACDIPKEIEVELGIRILPFSIAVGDESYLERVDFTNQEFYDLLS
ncbi:MAG: DegV family protein, partial [Oscillospiraceae bacterium]